MHNSKLSFNYTINPQISPSGTYLSFGLLHGGLFKGLAFLRGLIQRGSVLGPVLFLIYINDIVSDIDSKINLFADDCALYRVITSTEDALILQKDLDKLFR